MYLPTLSNKELLVYAEQTQDDLTTSDLERELTKRLGEVEASEVEASEVEASELLDVLLEEGFDEADELRDFFKRVREAQEKVAKVL